MALKFLDINNVSWYRGEKILYRGCLQSSFEARILVNLFEKGRAFYFGHKNIHQKIPLTFCSPSPLVASYFAVSCSSVNLLVSWLFSHFPLLMQIDAKKYQNRLCYSTEGEGIIITGPVELEDISVLFSSSINNLEGLLGKPWGSVRRDLILHRTALESLGKKDLLAKYRENPREVFEELWGLIYRDKKISAKEGILINEYIHVLKTKFR